MKIILSRKGFDSATGGVSSPIFPSGRCCSLPIPDARSPIRYGDVRMNVPELAPEHRLGALVHDLTRGALCPHAGAHLDPDLAAETLPRAWGWRPLFGQTGAAQGHLRRQGVGEGDLFLFYGWFRAVERVEGRWVYVPDAPDLHLLFGWLQVAARIPIRSGSARPDWTAYHPHCHPEFVANCADNNVLYVAAERLRLPGCGGCVPGAGLFGRYHPTLQLTAPGALRSVWRLPAWLFPTNAHCALSYHGDPRRWRRDGQHVVLRTVGRGQEFVFDTAGHPQAFDWLRSLFSLGTLPGF